jgi:hypothetical protein
MITTASKASIKVPKKLMDASVSKLIDRLKDEYTAHYLNNFEVLYFEQTYF